MFIHDFAGDEAMLAVYPLGAYGVKFVGTNPPTPATFTDGLVFESGTTYPSVIPRIDSVDNGAFWADNKLHLQPTGITTLKFNAFPEYSSTTYGSLIAVGIYDNSGNVIPSASLESYYLPVGDSSETPTPISQSPITQVTVDGEWFIPGRTYTLELQYTVIAGRPEEDNLNGAEFQGVSSYRRVVSVTIVAGAGSHAVNQDFDGDGTSELLWRNANTALVRSWTMAGAVIDFGNETGNWQVINQGDFDGDGRTEPLWRNSSTTEIKSITMAGTTINFGTENGGWSITQVADFDGDGRSEPLWRNSVSTEVKTWTMAGGSINFGPESGGWQVITTGDFDGDGRAELLWRNSGTTLIKTWTMAGGTYNFGPESGGWKVNLIGDFDGDGRSEILWRNTGTTQNATWPMAGGFLNFGPESNGWQIIGVYDFDGDGLSEPTWRNSDTTQIASWPMAGGFLNFGTESNGWSVIQ